MSGHCDASVVVCAYTEERWDDLVAGIGSALGQDPPPGEVIVVVDHNPELLRRVRAELPGVLAIANQATRGLSGARNTGIETSRGEVVTFLDDDACPEPGWLAALLAPYADPLVMGVGGGIQPRWPDERPSWWPPEFDWVVGCSYRGLPDRAEAVRNLIGANMSFRRRVFEEVGTFTEGMGRVGTCPVGCEETELCIRVGQRWPHSRMVYVPQARVIHRVTPGRASLRYFLRRCLGEGRSKALVSTSVGRRQALASERSYTMVALPRGVRRGLRDAVAGERSGAARAAAIVTGFAVTTVGYAVGQLRASRERRSRQRVAA